MINGLTFPKYLSIQTTSLCNASCLFCPYDRVKNLFPAKTMEINLYKKIIDECGKYKEVERIILYMNNEPLTDRYIIERINYAKEKIPGISVHLLTNGTLLDDKTADQLINSGLDWLGVSFHGIKKETIEKTMGIPYDLTFSRINKFIEKARKKKNLKEYLMITLLKHKYLTESEKDEAIKFWKNKGIERISYFKKPISRAGNVKKLSKVYNQGKITGCNSIWADEMLHIGEDGKVVLCCMDWKREVVLGDLNNQTVKEIWQGERKKTWEMIQGKREMPASFLCRRCEEAALGEPVPAVSCNSRPARPMKIISQKYNVLFINLPPWAQDNPHIGIGYLCSYLRKRGVLLKVIDLNKSFFLNYPEYKMLWHVENKNFWSDPGTYPLIAEIFKEAINRAVSEIVKINPLLVGISVVDPKERLAIDFIRRIKRRLPGSKIVLGGPAISTAKQRQIFLDEADRDIDLFVIGEGEKRCYEVVNRLKQGKSLEKINGTIVKTADGWGETLLKPSKNIEQIPFPTYEEFDMESYGKSLLVEWSRGCYNRCSFCKNWRLFPFYRAKEPEKVLDELKYQINTYGIRKFTVVDSILNGDPDKLYRICSLIIDNDLDIEWSGQIAPSEQMSYSFFKHVYQAGCRQLQIGVESADNRVLKKMRKSYTAKMSQKTLQNAKRAGIETEIFIIIGFPGEDEPAFRKTFDFIKRNREYIDTIKSINTLHLVAGTEVCERGRDFNMKPLPDKQWHFLWETYDGNNYKVRKRRAEKLLELAETLGIKVMEANIREGKEEAAKEAMAACGNRQELKKVFKNEINKLQALPEEKKKQRRKRSILKWSFLLMLYFFTLGYIIYFWIYMCLHGKVLLGGEVKKRR